MNIICQDKQIEIKQIPTAKITLSGEYHELLEIIYLR